MRYAFITDKSLTDYMSYFEIESRFRANPSANKVHHGLIMRNFPTKGAMTEDSIFDHLDSHTTKF